MRLFLLPVSTRRTFMYAQRLHVTTTQTDRNYVDRSAAWAAKKWSEWEKKESGWQSKVVHYGNQAFRRIPYEEWGLKSVPPLSARRQADEIQGKEKVELVFPSKVIPLHKAEQIARTLATERQSLHRTRLMWCFIGMPITIPFALVPVYVLLCPCFRCCRASFRFFCIFGLDLDKFANDHAAESPTYRSSTSYTERGHIGALSPAVNTYNG